MDFGSLTPEVNSARMYAGAGSAPLLSAATAWNSLAAELSSAADAYQAVVSELIDYGWLGPASTAMAAAAAPYAQWMTTTAAKAEQTAAQAADAAGAYEAAFAATVPPAEIAANRTQLASLVATNVLGQNAPAIAAVEALYGEMWAQDAAAMYGYAANSAAATQFSQFTTPAQNTNPAGMATQSTVAGSTAASGAQNTLSQLVSSVPNALQNMATPAASNSSGNGLGGILGNLFGGDNPFAPGTNTATTGISGFLNALDGSAGSSAGTFLSSGLTNGFVSAGYVSPAFISPAVTSALADINSLKFGAGALPGIEPGLGVGTPGLLPAIGGAGLPVLHSLDAPLAGGSPVAASVGHATLVGKLAVPQSWTPANQMTTPLNPGAMDFHTVGMTTPEAATPGMPGMPGMPMVGAGSRSSFSFATPRYGFRPTVMAQPPAAG